MPRHPTISKAKEAKVAEASSLSSPDTGRSPTGVSDRAAGAVMGALIGDALGVGAHWYYDLHEMRRDYGDWITGYTDPQPDRYHAGLKTSQLSIQEGKALARLDQRQ